jgi:hypothetical protein
VAPIDRRFTSVFPDCQFMVCLSVVLWYSTSNSDQLQDIHSWDDSPPPAKLSGSDQLLSLPDRIRSCAPTGSDHSERHTVIITLLLLLLLLLITDDTFLYSCHLIHHIVYIV